MAVVTMHRPDGTTFDVEPGDLARRPEFDAETMKGFIVDCYVTRGDDPAGALRQLFDAEIAGDPEITLEYNAYFIGRNGRLPESK